MTRSTRKTAVVAALLAAGVVLAGPPTVAEAGRLLTGKAIKDGSLTSRDYRDGSVRSVDIADGTITARDLAPGLAVPGATGPSGAPGPAGAAGSPGSDGSPGASADRLYEVRSWDVAMDNPDASTQLSRQSGEVVPAGAQLEALSLQVTGMDTSRCRYGASVSLQAAGRELALWTNGSTFLREVGTLASASTLTLAAQCIGDSPAGPGRLVVPRSDVAAVVRWSAAPTTPTGTMD